MPRNQRRGSRCIWFTSSVPIRCRIRGSFSDGNHVDGSACRFTLGATPPIFTGVKVFHRPKGKHEEATEVLLEADVQWGGDQEVRLAVQPYGLKVGIPTAHGTTLYSFRWIAVQLYGL